MEQLLQYVSGSWQGLTLLLLNVIIVSFVLYRSTALKVLREELNILKEKCGRLETENKEQATTIATLQARTDITGINTRLAEMAKAFEIYQTQQSSIMSSISDNIKTNTQTLVLIKEDMQRSNGNSFEEFAIVRNMVSDIKGVMEKDIERGGIK